MEDAKPRMRRRHSGERKRQILAECAVPGASVASIALAHGLNANLVHKWRRQAARGGAASPPAAFVAVSLPALEAPVAEVIELELQRSAVTVRVRWPIVAASSCAAWLREVLR